jgi:uncharacterized protein (DUF2336 family)
MMGKVSSRFLPAVLGHILPHCLACIRRAGESHAADVLASILYPIKESLTMLTQGQSCPARFGVSGAIFKDGFSVLIRRHFFDWARHAPAAERAKAVQSLIGDYLEAELSPAEKSEIEGILTNLLEDPSPLVRRAMASALSSEARAPHHLVSALSMDQTDVAILVLAHSPQFSGAELAQAARHSASTAQLAIALRPDLPAEAAAVIADCAEPAVLVALAANHSAHLSDVSMLRMIERAGDVGKLRENLLARPDLAPAARVKLAEIVADLLGNFLARTQWLPQERAGRILRDARDRVAISSVAGDGQGAVGAATSLVSHLRAKGQLTSSLFLRSLVTGDRLLFEAALVDLSGLSRSRVASLCERPSSGGFQALYARARLPASVQLVFAAVLTAMGGSRGTAGAGSAPRRRLVHAAIEACHTIPAKECGSILALLRRFESEAAREEARHAAMADALPVFGPV